MWSAPCGCCSDQSSVYRADGLAVLKITYMSHVCYVLELLDPLSPNNISAVADLADAPEHLASW